MRTLSNGAVPTTVLAETQAPAAKLYPEILDVRAESGALLGKIKGEHAAEYVARGWMEPIGARRIKYVRLTKNSPLRPRPDGRWMHPTTTQPVRADASCAVHTPGQCIKGGEGTLSAGRLLVEHKPVGSDRTLYDGWRTAVRPFRLRSSGKATKP